jgi:hypothetical protein
MSNSCKYSLYWSRRGQAPHSLLVTVLSPKNNIVILLLINPLCVECEYVISYRTCKLTMKGE